MSGADPYIALTEQFGGLLRGDGDPRDRHALAKSLSVLLTVKAAEAVYDLTVQLGSVTAAAEALEISPQAVSQILTRHGYESPRRPGRPKKETNDATDR